MIHPKTTNAFIARVRAGGFRLPLKFVKRKIRVYAQAEREGTLRRHWQRAH
jgi:hypothetical protein